MPFGSHFSEPVFQHAKWGSVLAFAAIVACATAMSSTLYSQSFRTGRSAKVSIPIESSGIDGVVQTLVSVLDHSDVLALGEAHGRFRQEGDLRIALVRNPDFAKKVHSIVVEFASSTEQATLDRYIRGENVPNAELAQVWKSTTQAANGNDIWDDPIYSNFFAAVRDVNQKLPSTQQIRILAGDPGQRSSMSRDVAAVSPIEQVLRKHEKVLVIFGAAHFYRTMDANYLAATGDDNDIVKTLEKDYPGRTYVVIPIGRLDKPHPVTVDMAPDYQKIDHALKAHVRPVLVTALRPPFRDFSVEEFLGRSVTTCRGLGGCKSAFKGSTLTLGQMADALVYFGGDEDAEP